MNTNTTPDAGVRRITKLDAANAVLQAFAEETRIEFDGPYVVIAWTQYGGKKFRKRWMTRGGGHHPVWHYHWGHGGTACQALYQLVRWLKDKPVLPIGPWRWWTSPTVALGREKGPEMIQTLRDAGYPEHAECVLCHNQIEGSLDWWDLNGVSGPCCGWTSGCRQVQPSPPVTGGAT